MKPESKKDVIGVASHALLGSSVLLRSGGHDAPSPGQFRHVKATYIGERGNQVCCRLEQDDPDACVGYCTQKGDVGWWGRSIMSLPNDQVAMPEKDNTERSETPCSLSPCPFCGTEGLKAEYYSFGTTFYCEDGCHGQFNFPAFIHEVDEMWRQNLKSNGQDQPRP